MSDAPGQNGAAARWCDQLAQADEDTWQAFAEQPPAVRSEVTRALKARVDALCRQSAPAALPLAQALVRAANGLPDELPLALRGRGASAHFNGDQQSARADFEEAARLHRERGQMVESARALRSLVDVNQMAGRSDDAIDAARRAAAIFEAHGETRLLAQLRINLGNVYTRLDEYASAEEHYAAARESFEQLHDPVGLAFADYNLALVAMNANRCDDADRRWHAARRGMIDAKMPMLVADCDYSLAYLESRRGRFERAIEGLARSRSAYLANGKPSGPALCDLDLAEIQLRLGTVRDALENAAQAARAFEGLDMPYEQARAEVLMGMARSRLGDDRGALADLDRAEARFSEQGNHSLAAFVGLQRAQVEISRGRAGAVLDDLRQRRGVLVQRGTIWLADMLTLTLARALVMWEQPEQASRELAALRDERPAGSQLDPLLDAIALRISADALSASGDSQGALHTLRRAVAAIDATWSQVPRGDVRIAFFRDQHPAFVDLTFLLLDVQRGDEALLVLEQGRSRSLAENSPLARQPEWKAERERLEWLLARQLDAELGPLAGGSDLSHERHLASVWCKQIDLSRRRLAAIARGDGGEGAATPLHLDAAELSPACRDDELLLVYLCGRPGVRVLAIHSGPDALRVEGVDLGLDLDELTALRERFLFHLARRRMGRSAERRLAACLAELGTRLLAPLAHRLHGPRGPRPLVIVPYGPLHGLPVHAFELDGEPLVARHELSEAISVWHLARVRRQGRRPRGSVSGFCSGSTLEVLPAIERELEDLQELFDGRIQRLPADQMVEKMTDGSLSGTLLHLAGHGRFEAHKPRFSAVCLGSRFLLAHDISSLSIDVDLATLSGCETGRSGYTGGDELLGLPRALLGAGVRSVLGSLWPVRDTDAAQFMHSFYEHFAAGQPARRCLSQAQRAMRSRTDDPVAWAAFSLLGDPDVSAAVESPDATPRGVKR